MVNRSVTPLRVNVIGDSLAGMAAAARLAKQGHQVTLVETGAAPTGLPDVFPFPAPWRDLFKKSGRAFDVELGRAGFELVSVPTRRVQTPDGVLDLPTERGQQWYYLAECYNEQLATQWRDLLDLIDEVWQHRRRLGLEFEHDPKYARKHLSHLWATMTVADIAHKFDHPALSQVILGAAEDDPRRSPATDCVWLAVERTFGLWQMVDADQRPVGTQTLVDLLRERLALRKVTVTDSPAAAADATVEATGVMPTDLLRRPKPWWKRSGSRLGKGRYTCGDHTASGTTMAGQLLSGALATYALHQDLTGQNIHPTYKPDPKKSAAEKPAN